MLKGKCESKLQPNCIYGSLPLPSLSLSPSPFLCNLPPHTHTRSEILSNIFLHNSPHGTNEATFSLKKMRFARFWMQAACKQPFPIPYFSVSFTLFISFPLSLPFLSICSLSFDGKNCIDQRKSWGWSANKKLVAVCVLCWRGVWATLAGIKT